MGRWENEKRRSDPIRGLAVHRPNGWLRLADFDNY